MRESHPPKDTYCTIVSNHNSSPPNLYGDITRFILPADVSLRLRSPDVTSCWSGGSTTLFVLAAFDRSFIRRSRAAAAAASRVHDLMALFWCVCVFFFVCVNVRNLIRQNINNQTSAEDARIKHMHARDGFAAALQGSIFFVGGHALVRSECSFDQIMCVPFIHAHTQPVQST